MIPSRRCIALATMATLVTLTACNGTNSLGSGVSASGVSPDGRVSGATSCPCLYVANRGTFSGANPSVTIYPASAQGNTAPSTSIAGENTGLTDPWGVALDSANHLYVSNSTGNSIT